MGRFDIDPETAERLLRGDLAPDDAPPGYGGVARLLRAVPPTASGPLSARAATVAATAAAVQSHPAPTTVPRRSVLMKAKLAAASLAGALALTTGLAAANALPGAAQSVASDTLAKVGVSVPNPNGHSAGHAHHRGKSTDHPASPSDESTATPNAHADFGLCTAAAAHEKNGAEPKSTVFPSATTCSTVDHPGQHNGPDGADDTGKPESPGSQGNRPASAGPPSSTPAPSAPVATPNSGGTTTANTASDGHSSTGTGTADTASDGHSSAGSSNSSGHRP